MPFIPHTANDEALMLDVIGVPDKGSLFDEIPPALRGGRLESVPSGISEMAMLRLMAERAENDAGLMSYLGAGAYEHHIPSAVWDITSRGEFLTAYTPYQAEASQGTLQLIYEFQTMMSRLTAMDVANASVYDGATALAEAMLMAVRANKKSRSRRILCAGNVNPRYLSACESIVHNQDIEIVQIPWNERTGTLDKVALDPWEDDHAALVVSYPNFFGGLDDVGRLTDWAHARNMLVIAVVNPMALGLLQPPGEWGEEGADIAVGDGQPFGIPVASGGPYLGTMCCRQSIVRQMPGRIIGRTVDLDGKTGFALTLQAREQHIRRAKATSNICTNQGLLVTAATIYMSLLGDQGLYATAAQCHANTVELAARVCMIEGVSLRFPAPYFHEIVIELPVDVGQVLSAMVEQGVVGGLDLTPVLDRCLLCNVTETKTMSDLDDYARILKEAIVRVKG